MLQDIDNSPNSSEGSETVTVLNENETNVNIQNTANSQEEEEENVEYRNVPAEVSPAASTTTQVVEENYDDEPDETIAERLWGLTEMFPDPVREYAGKISKLTTITARKFFSVSCRIIWVVASSSVILFAPVFLEVQRAEIRESQMSQQKNVLLGPAAVMSANPMGRGSTNPFQKAT